MTRLSDRTVLPVLELGAHCPVSWDAMPKSHSGRRCDQCARVVYDFESMTVEEILAVFDGTTGSICARVSVNANGHVLNRSTAAGLILTATMGASHASLALPSDAQETRQAPTTQAQSLDPQSAREKPARPTGIRGAVTERGEPLAGAQVAAITRDRRGAHTTTDAQGLYSFTDLSPGLYSVRFSVPGRIIQNPEVSEILVCFGTVIVHDLHPQLPMMGSVIHRPAEGQQLPGAGQTGISGEMLSADRVGIPGGTVIATPVAAEDQGRHVTTTDQTGRFVLGGLQPGTYSLTFAALGFIGDTLDSVQIKQGALSNHTAHLCRVGN